MKDVERQIDIVRVEKIKSTATCTVNELNFKNKTPSSSEYWSDLADNLTQYFGKSKCSIHLSI